VGQARVLVAMDMEQSNTSAELQGTREGELCTLVYPVVKVDPVLAHDIIHNQCNRNIFHVIGESLANAVVHIDLPGRPQWLDQLDKDHIYIPLAFLEVHNRLE
jgi:hypothetical protein